MYDSRVSALHMFEPLCFIVLFCRSRCYRLDLTSRLHAAGVSTLVGDALPHWPAWTPAQHDNLEIVTPTPFPGTSLDLCTFWDTIGYMH